MPMETTKNNKKQTILLRLALLFVLAGACFVVFVGNRQIKHDREIAKEETYIKIYESQAIEKLKKENRELYDSLQVVSDKKPESALVVKWKYKYLTDTIYVDKFEQDEDSVYHYVTDNDTIRTEIDVAARELAWMRVQHTFNSRFMIINRIGDNGTVETTINHAPNIEIQGVAAWHNKKSWKDRLFIGPSIQTGYDPIRKKATISVGISAGYNLLSH